MTQWSAAIEVLPKLARLSHRSFFVASLSLVGSCLTNDAPIEWEEFPAADSQADGTNSDGSGTEVGETGVGHNDSTAENTSSQTATNGTGTNGDDSNQTTQTDATSNAGTGTCMGPCGSAGCGACPEIETVNAGPFAIDATEVTYREYVKFVDSGYSLGNQSAQCRWNDSFVPKASWPALIGQLDFPVVYVNWCQAQAFCNWRGAHLCGKIGGGPNDYASYNTVSKSQWYFACTGGGDHEYPYGDGTYNPIACNGKEYGIKKSLPVPAVPTCKGHFDGPYDLSGNIYEWTDECETGDLQSKNCRRRGGSYFSDVTSMRCANGSARARDHVDDYTGFRCCVETP